MIVAMPCDEAEEEIMQRGVCEKKLLNNFY